MLLALLAIKLHIPSVDGAHFFHLIIAAVIQPSIIFIGRMLKSNDYYQYLLVQLYTRVDNVLDPFQLDLDMLLVIDHTYRHLNSFMVAGRSPFFVTEVKNLLFVLQFLV